jgi:hypothetical protein
VFSNYLCVLRQVYCVMTHFEHSSSDVLSVSSMEDEDELEERRAM